MADTIDEAVHREAVQLQIQAEILKKNSNIVTDAQLEMIKQFLLGIAQVQKATKRRIMRNDFVLKTFAGDPDVVCVFKNVRFSKCLFIGQ